MVSEIRLIIRTSVGRRAALIMTTQEAMTHIRELLHKDQEYAFGWYSNLIMPMIDAGVTREIAEDAVGRIMYNFFQLKKEQYQTP